MILRCVCWFVVLSVSAMAQIRETNRVPPIGIPISANDREALTARLKAFEVELKKISATPDVRIFHKAVDWALRYDEFYRSNEVAAAHKLVEQGIERAKAAAQGQKPWATATGLVVRAYQSRIDNSIQPYGLVVPPSFAEKKSEHRFRLDVWLHGRDNLLTELKFMTDRQRSYGEFTPPDTIVLHPYGRFCNAFKFAGEVDVFEAIEDVKKNYPIDVNRIAIRGFSMGGGGTWHLASHYPSYWVAAAPGAGFAETAEFQRIWSRGPQPSWYDQKLWNMYDATVYAGNFFNLPVIAYSGELDRQKQAADIMEKYMAQEGLKLTHLIGPKTEHKYEPETKKELDRQFSMIVDPARRDSNPLKFTTYTLRYNSNNWIRVDGLERHWERADVRAEFVDGGRYVRIDTTNVSALTIISPRMKSLFGKNAIDAATKLTVNGMEFPDLVFETEPLRFEKSGKKWRRVSEPRAGELRKRSGAQGPIDDAFMDSFIVVRPTGKPMNAAAHAWIEDELAHATDEWRNQFRGDAIVKADTELSDEDIANNHLILWGDPQSNKVLGRIARKLPARWSGETVRIAGKKFAADKFVPVFIFPNPLNPKRYVVVNSGFTFCEYGRSSNALQIPKLPDYAVLDMTVDRTSRYTNGVAFAGFFDETWGL
jgi:pimeloyl-ACP methyl ester carboxylesterase